MNKGIISLLLIFFFAFRLSVSAQSDLYKTCPFSTNTTSLTVWNGNEYVPITLKGINLGVGVPGTFPSELKVSYEQYYKWFEMMRDAGFNLIRVYTLHFPQFYAALRQYNLDHPQSPLLVLHGVWLEEEGGANDLFNLKDIFEKEISDNIDCVHGNNIIQGRLGKAYGTFTADISDWTLGYIIGREVFPEETISTNQKYPTKTSYTGDYLTISNVAATEVFITSMMDFLLKYEETKYKTQRPVSFSSWPTLDPLSHPTEISGMEDKVSVDLSGIDIAKAKAGIFISYHAYPYYPDFVSNGAEYQSFYDYLGQNSYLGYLTYLKAHYSNLPLIIAEFGVPSSFGIAHYSQSGMNHGGLSERQQGEANMRLFNNIIDAGCGGGIMFSWMDEWFKRTWITDPMDFPMDRRILWQNITSAEQNFGLIGFSKNDEVYIPWGSNCPDCPLTKMQATTNFRFFKMKIELLNTFGAEDSMWIALDTYRPDLGESVLPNGKQISNRAEFALLITGGKAELYVAQAYDLFGIWHKTSAAEQLYHSIASDGKPWRLVRWKNNQGEQEVQYIGILNVNRLNLPLASTDAVIISDKSIEIRLPWTLLQFTDPSTKTVMNDDRSTLNVTETAISDGIAVTAFYKGQSFSPGTRFLWENWNHALNTTEYKKQSFWIVKEQLPYFQGGIVAGADSFNIENSINFSISKDQLLQNDHNYDGGKMEIIVTQSPMKGHLLHEANGNFTYIPPVGFNGSDEFSYKLTAGVSQSQPATVMLFVYNKPSGIIAGNNWESEEFADIFPNPSTGRFSFKCQDVVNKVDIFDTNGMIVQSVPVRSITGNIELSQYPKGIYIARLTTGSRSFIKKLVVH